MNTRLIWREEEEDGRGKRGWVLAQTIAAEVFRTMLEWCSDADESACMSMRLACARHWRGGGEEGEGWGEGERTDSCYPGGDRVVQRRR